MSLALDFLGGAVFTLLYDGVKQALGKSSTFGNLLKDLKFTLESLKRLQATAIQQIGHYNLELGLANDEIEDLRKQMEEGTKLITKLSTDLRLWNYCCINGYTDQLVDLDRSLKRLLENLRLQEARDVKEILDLLRKTRDELNEVRALLQKLLQEKMDGPSAPGSNMETAPEPNGGNSAEQGGPTELGAVFGMLFHVVIQMKDKTTIFRPLLGDLKCTLDSLKPMMEEVAQHNNVLNCPKEEQEKLKIQMDKGVELIFKCSKVGLWANYNKYEYTNRLLGLDECLRRQLSELRGQVAREVRETLAQVNIIKTKIKEIEGIGVFKNDVDIEGLCKVPELPSLADDLNVVEVQGTVDVIKGTFVSPRTIEEDGVEGVEGIVGIQNQLEVQVSCEVPEAPLPTVGLDPLHVQGTRNEMQDTLVTTIAKVEEVKGIEGSAVTEKQPENKGSCDVHESPSRFFKRQFSDPSPATHKWAVLARGLGLFSWKKQGSKTKLHKSFGYVSGEKAKELGKAKELEDQVEGGMGLFMSFGFSKNFTTMYELGKEVGRGHFSFTCIATFKKGELEGHHAAVKIISKARMTTAVAIEDVRREVEIMKALTGHSYIVKFYDAYEDHDNVYIVMEYCEGGDLLERILARNGMYTEDDARTVMIRILSAVAFCHLQCVVHRDIKLENFMFISRDEDLQIKVIDFGLSNYVKPDQRLKDIVGSAYYVAPEVLHRSYSTEADMWSVGVIAYIMLSGSRPFWARTESGIFRSVLRANPSFDETAWPSRSTEAKDFVKHLLNKDRRKRMTAAQALNHLWLRNYNDLKVPLDILIFKLMKAYMHSSSLRKSALRALSKTLTPDDLSYMEEQFEQLEPDGSGTIGLENIRMALMKNAADAVTEGRYADIIASLNVLQYRRMEFQEFCAATLCVHQLEALDQWEQQSSYAYRLFDKDGNNVVVMEDLVSELDLSPSAHAHTALHDWIRQVDGKLSFVGFAKLLHGVSGRILDS